MFLKAISLNTPPSGVLFCAFFYCSVYMGFSPNDVKHTAAGKMAYGEGMKQNW